MKRKAIRYLSFAVLLILTLAIMSGCKKKETAGEPAEAPSPTAAEVQPPDGTTEPVPTEAPDISATPSASAKTPSNTRELPIYTLNDDSMECEAVVAMIPDTGKITAQIIVDTVVDAIGEHGLQVGIDAVTSDKDRVIVSFKSDSAPIWNTGSGVESTILDCIAQSLLDNLEECKNVVFRVDGKAYESGHNYYEIDEPYMKK